MKKKKFKYGWLERIRFSAERKRQLIAGINRYETGYDRNAESYWQITADLPAMDTDQLDVLSEFSKTIAVGKGK